MTRAMPARWAIEFGDPRVDLDRLRQWKNQVINKLANGLMDLSKKRSVQVLKGRAVFESSERARFQNSETGHIRFRHAIIATGSTATSLPATVFKKGGRIMSSAAALSLPDIPGRLLVVGGGYVGVELGSVYASLGSRVTLVEAADRLMAGADRDLVQPLLAG